MMHLKSGMTFDSFLTKPHDQADAPLVKFRAGLILRFKINPSSTKDGIITTATLSSHRVSLLELQKGYS